MECAECHNHPSDLCPLSEQSGEFVFGKMLAIICRAEVRLRFVKTADGVTKKRDELALGSAADLKKIMQTTMLTTPATAIAIAFASVLMSR